MPNGIPAHVGRYAIERCVPAMLRRALAHPAPPADHVWVLLIEWADNGWAWDAYLAPWSSLEGSTTVPVGELRAQVDRFGGRALVAAVTIGEAAYSEVVEWSTERAAPAAAEGSEGP